MKNIDEYLDFKRQINELNYINNVLYYDASTDCPKLSQANSFAIQAKIQQKIFDLLQSEEYKELISVLAMDKSLPNLYAKAIKKEQKELDRYKAIPSHLYKKHLENTSRAYLAWELGRETDDFTKFEVELVELVDYYKNYIKLNEKANLKGYDVLLNIFEEDFTQADYDALFAAIEIEIVPLIKKIINLPKREINLSGSFSIAKQKELTEEVRSWLAYDKDRGTIRETLHPYTICVGENDVRITTNYDEKNLFSNLYSIMHEIGHALYQLNVDKKYMNTSLNGSPSMAFDESQSRFMENYIGRDENFLVFLKPYLEVKFPEFKNISTQALNQYVNKVEANLIRIDADELTYPVHILIRYKIEKELFSGELEVKNISKRFDDLLEQYLGIRPKNKNEGCYQDVHWSSDFGYFPTYALGSAIGAQLLYYLKKELDFSTLLLKGELEPILSWLAKNVHSKGGFYSTRELLKDVTGEDFNLHYYIDYLKTKFTKLYEEEK